MAEKKTQSPPTGWVVPTGKPWQSPYMWSYHSGCIGCLPWHVTLSRVEIRWLGLREGPVVEAEPALNHQVDEPTYCKPAQGQSPRQVPSGMTAARPDNSHVATTKTPEAENRPARICQVGQSLGTKLSSLRCRPVGMRGAGVGGHVFVGQLSPFAAASPQAPGSH